MIFFVLQCKIRKSHIAKNRNWSVSKVRKLCLTFIRVRYNLVMPHISVCLHFFSFSSPNRGVIHIFSHKFVADYAQPILPWHCYTVFCCCLVSNEADIKINDLSTWDSLLTSQMLFILHQILVSLETSIVFILIIR
jgi:hypothetical protein